MRYALRSLQSLRSYFIIVISVVIAIILSLLRLLLLRLLLLRLLPLLCLYILEVQGVALYTTKALSLLPFLYSDSSLRAALALTNERLKNRGININRVNIKVAILVIGHKSALLRRASPPK